jgi:hypothetical protein
VTQSGTTQGSGDYNGILRSPYATVSQPITGPQNLYDQFGRVIPPTNDPAWQRPTDPLKDTTALRAQAGVIPRQIPIIDTQEIWSVADTRSAIFQLSQGFFDTPSQLVEAILADDRVQATLGSRTDGLLGAPVDHVVPRKLKDSPAAKEVCDAWCDAWDQIANEPAMGTLLEWDHMLKFSPAQLIWSEPDDDDVMIPTVTQFHPRYTYWHPTLYKYIAITMDGQMVIEPGDGTWVIHASRGYYRGWMHGAVRAIATPWLMRNFARRDWARYCERHGMPALLAMTPAAADPNQVALFRAALANLGQESVVQLPQGVDKQFSYDLKLLEAQDANWQAFPGFMDRMDSCIVLALLYQNLTTEVTEGSFAAARTHADVRQAALKADARALARTIYTQIARPFAAMNFGDANLAPKTTWQITPYEDNEAAGRTFVSFASAVASLKQAGKDLTALAPVAKSFGLDLSMTDITDAPPPVVAAAPMSKPAAGGNAASKPPVPKV